MLDAMPSIVRFLFEFLPFRFITPQIWKLLGESFRFEIAFCRLEKLIGYKLPAANILYSGMIFISNSKLSCVGEEKF